MDAQDTVDTEEAAAIARYFAMKAAFGPCWAGAPGPRVRTPRRTTRVPRRLPRISAVPHPDETERRS